MIGLFILIVLVILHEAGHMVVAKLCGVKVEEFSVGMGPALFHFTGKSGTVYSFRLLPLGGYCSMEDGEEPLPDGTISATSMAAAKWWKKILIYLAGPAVNFIVAGLIILGLIFSNSGVAFAASVEGESYDCPFYGYEIVKIDDFHIFTEADIVYAQNFSDGSFDVTWIDENGDKQFIKNYVPESGNIIDDITVRGYAESVPDKISYALNRMGTITQSIFISLKYLFTGQVSTDSVGGPISIVAMFNGQDAKTVLNLAAFISLNLGFMNLLPLPVLDGGQVLITLIERIFKRKLNEKVRTVMAMACFILLVGLIVFLSINDIKHLL